MKRLSFTMWLVLVVCIVPINVQAQDGLYPRCMMLEEIDWEAYSAARVDIERKHPSLTSSGEVKVIVSTDTWRIMSEEGLVRVQYEDLACILLHPDDAEDLARALRLLATTPEDEKISRRGLAWSLSVSPGSYWQIGTLVLRSAPSAFLGAEIPPDQMGKFAEAIDRVLKELPPYGEDEGSDSR